MRLEQIIVALRTHRPWLGESELVVIAARVFNRELHGSQRQRRPAPAFTLIADEVRTYAGNDKTRLESEVKPAYWKSMLEIARNDGPWPMLLTGPVGTGKTCAALCLLDRINGGRRYFGLPEMCEVLIAVQKGQVEYSQVIDTQASWWARLKYHSMVVIDELGRRDSVSDFQIETLQRVLDVREGRPTLYITNQPMSKLAALYDDRIASRLSAGVRVKFAGKDRRMSK